MHVVNVQPPIRYADLLPVQTQQLAEQWSRESGENSTGAARELLTAAAIPCHLQVVVGDPASAIVKVAVELSCDPIVMGTRGMAAVAGLALGSVATKVVHLCGHTSHVGEATALSGLARIG